MKSYKYILFSIVAGMVFVGCQEDESFTNTHSEITFSPTIMEQEAGSRALGNDFFVEGNKIDVKITTRNANGTTGTENLTYEFNNQGIFKGDPGYYFPIDDRYIAELIATWPSKEETDGQEANTIPTNQRELENYRKADWLSAVATLEGLMPTVATVPLAFQHNNCMLEFQLTGQTSSTLKIETLVLELILDGEKTAFWAYCGGDTGNAELILKAGTRIDVPEGYMIGRAQVMQGTTKLNYTIIMPETDLILLAGHKYLVTLSGTGYDLNASIAIKGWGQPDHAIGIPLQQPGVNENGDYVINTPAQLVTASYLIRNYTDATTIRWPEKTYILSDNFSFTKDYLPYWIPIPRTNFTGKMIREGLDVNFIEYYDQENAEMCILDLFK